MEIGKIYVSGEIGVDCSLLDVIKQVKAQPHATEFIVRIDSIGGYVDEGYSIYNYLKNLDVTVTTYAIKAFSIASVIFMAGDKRLVPEGAQDVLMVHLPWGQAMGNADELQAYQKELKKVEDELVDFYSKAINIDSSTILSLLKQETYLDAEQAVSLGFATQVQTTAKAVAKLNYNNRKEEQDSFMNKIEKKITAIYNKVFGIKAELVLQDATGLEIVFPELAPEDTPEAGDKATVDGAPAEGELLTPDGRTLVFEGGELKEVKEAEAPTEETTEETPEAAETEEAPAQEADKDALIAELEAKIKELEEKLAELLPTEAADKMLEALGASLEKQEELEKKFNALAKQVGSDFQPQEATESTSATVKAKEADKPKFSIKRK